MAEARFDCDVAVLGGGPGGTAAALRAAARGARVCLVEAGQLGGVCLNVGCIPTKAMLSASETFWRMRHAMQLGINSAAPSVDGEAFMKRVGGVVETLRQGARERVDSVKLLEVVRGRGRLTDGRTIAVEGPGATRQITAGAIVIATGSRPVKLDFLSWGSPRLMTSDQAATATDLPASVIVVGGGPLGCEFATMYAELGVRTCVVEMLERLLAELDVEASEAVTKLLADRGAEVLTGRKVADVKATDDGVEARLDDGRILNAACAVVAVGRRANIEDIGLAQAGVEVADGIITVDDRCRTNVQNIYAVGDVAEKRQYAHLAERMGAVAAENATGHDLRDDRAVVPIGVYTHPQVASVGLTEPQARERFGRLRVLRHSYRDNAMALACGETDGQVKILAHNDTGAILGALWIGSRAVDMIHELVLAMRQGITLEQIHHTIHAHPTFQEAIRAAVEPWIAQRLRKRT